MRKRPRRKCLGPSIVPRLDWSLLPISSTGVVLRRLAILVVGGVLLLLLLGSGGTVQADVQERQPSAALNGFVTDAGDGRVLSGANVVLQNLADSTVTYGEATDPDGLYLIDHIRPGRYVVEISFVGYAPSLDTLQLAAGEQMTHNVALSRREATLEEVVVEEARAGPTDKVGAGERIDPEEIERLPTPDIQADLSSYLTLLPGTVTMADRGGQLFIRGGEPSHNMILLDGMVLYQPFHMLEFYSAFPAEIIDHTDFYAGGYGAKYGRRLSSVLDISSRTGNKHRFNGSVGLSPFLGQVYLEGPLGTDNISGLIAGRQSVLQRGAGPLIGEDLPFVFGDAFGKIHADVTKNSRFSVTAIRTYDRGTLRPDPDVSALPTETIEAEPFGEVRWQNWGVGTRYLTVPPDLPVIADVQVSISGLQTELGPSGSPIRESGVQTTRIAFEARFPGDTTTIRTGFQGSFSRFSHHLGGLYQDTFTDELTTLDHIVAYLEPDIRWGSHFRVRPGIRLQFLKSRFHPFLAPRLRMSWEQGLHRISAAGGLYYQEAVGLTDRRDAASVFTAWTNIPKHSGLPVEDVRRGRTPRAVHGLLGYGVELMSSLNVTLEGYYKHLSDLFIAEWTAFPRFTTGLQPAQGRSYGLEVRLDGERDFLYGSLGYGYSNTRYNAQQREIELWYGTESLRFRPPHDRRHQVSALVGVNFDHFNASVRWQFSSGRPYSRIVGFDGFAPITRVEDAKDISGTRRVIYEAPFKGLLPPYHRLDVSVEGTFPLTNNATLAVQGTVVNAYNRRNIFYLDTFTLKRVDQLPFAPSLGIALRYE